jgi:hypothetical protein
MCLWIDKNIHPDLEPLVADRDILVYKHLYYWENHKCTPYRFMPIDFSDGGMTHFPLVSLSLNKEFKLTREYADCVNFGYHAYRNSFQPLLVECKQFTAVIPKGTRYFIGDSDDIVAEQMIVFSYEFVRKEHYPDAVEWSKE